MSSLRRLVCGAMAAVGLLLGGCETAAFQSDVATTAKPWTNLKFDDANDSFTFAIVSDLESGYRPGVFEVAAAQLGLMRPALVLTIGDQIEGGTEDEARLRKEWDTFDARLSALHAPYFHIGGNHDLTNLTQRKVWEERYGPRYYSFVYKNVLFLALD
ncbi:MAG TPA: metallophosphoesterase, partial [Hyphomonadaceae bacterium]|nr:metallophosphoesterase [Hyphomonadaceae bacterium]